MRNNTAQATLSGAGTRLTSLWDGAGTPRTVLDAAVGGGPSSDRQTLSTSATAAAMASATPMRTSIQVSRVLRGVMRRDVAC